MKKRKMFTWLACASGFIGLGMLIGHAMSGGTNNSAMWVGAILVVLGSVLAGMAISSQELIKHDPANKSDQENTSTSKN